MKAILKAIKAILASMRFVVRQVFRAGKWVSEVVVERVAVPLAHVADAGLDVIERVAGLPLRILRGGSPAPTVSPAPQIQPSKVASVVNQAKPANDSISSFGHALAIKKAIKAYLSDEHCVKDITHPVVLRLIGSCIAKNNNSLLKLHSSPLNQIADHIDGKCQILGVPSMKECLLIEKTPEYNRVLTEFRHLKMPKKPEFVPITTNQPNFSFNKKYAIKA
jgi:hypothetical protein